MSSKKRRVKKLQRSIWVVLLRKKWDEKLGRK